MESKIIENSVFLGDCKEILPNICKKTLSMIYIDPPFNTGKIQKRDRQKKGKKIETSSLLSYEDKFNNFEEFLLERIKLSIPLLKDNGSLFVHLNEKEVHYIKVALDKILGRDNFMNEIIYTWDYGGKSKKKWSCKHDNILWYVMNPKDYIFNFDEIDRIPYKAPGLVKSTSKNFEEKIKNGKIVNSVWDLGIVHTMSKENVRYPTQKPIKLLERLLKVHTNPGDIVMDFFAGSGTLGVAAKNNNRKYILIDQSKEAISVMKSRLQSC